PSTRRTLSSISVIVIGADGSSPTPYSSVWIPGGRPGNGAYTNTPVSVRRCMSGGTGPYPGTCRAPVAGSIQSAGGAAVTMRDTVLSCVTPGNAIPDRLRVTLCPPSAPARYRARIWYGPSGSVTVAVTDSSSWRKSTTSGPRRTGTPTSAAPSATPPVSGACGTGRTYSGLSWSTVRSSRIAANMYCAAGWGGWVLPVIGSSPRP